MFLSWNGMAPLVPMVIAPIEGSTGKRCWIDRQRADRSTVSDPLLRHTSLGGDGISVLLNDLTRLL